MNEKTDKYTAELARHLRFRGVDEKQVQEAVWTVESHTADSGTSPRQAFGSPRDYARTFTPATTAGPGDTPLYLVGWLIGTLAGALLIISVSAQDQEVVLGLLPPGRGHRPRVRDPGRVGRPRSGPVDPSPETQLHRSLRE